MGGHSGEHDETCSCKHINLYPTQPNTLGCSGDKLNSSANGNPIVLSFTGKPETCIASTGAVSNYAAEFTDGCETFSIYPAKVCTGLPIINGTQTKAALCYSQAAGVGNVNIITS